MTAAAHSPILRHPFVNFDEFDYVVPNHITNGIDARLCALGFSPTTQDNWYPVT